MTTDTRFSIKTIVLLGAAGIAVMLAIALIAWNRIPGDQLIPMHWGISGEPDGYGPKPLALLGVPAVMSFATFAYWLQLRSRTDLHLFNDAAPFIYGLWVCVLVLMSVAEGSIVMTALGQSVPVSQIMLTGCGFLLGFAGFGTIKHPEISSSARRNKTPGDLKICRYSGMVMVAMGISILGCALAGSIVACVVIIVAGVAIILAMRIYSSFVDRAKT